MKIISSLSDFSDWRNNLSASTSIGFVPTMGALHAGHLSLVSNSILNTDITVVSIFVNPKQFSENEDFDLYPRTIKNDLKILGDAGVDVVFTPSYKDVYNKGVESFLFKDPFAETLEGRARPHFFPGVIDVVSRLFNIVSPDYSYFGKKDAQQLILIKKLVQLAGFSIKIVPVDTVREKNGLAMSSRNKYLSPKSRRIASCLYNSLIVGENLLLRGKADVNLIKIEMYKIIQKFEGVVVDYISIVCLDELKEIKGDVSGPALLSVAVDLEGVRLIDSIFYNLTSKPISTL